MKYLILTLFSVILVACSVNTLPGNPEPTEPSITGDNERYWNEVLELTYWETQNSTTSPQLLLNDEALNSNQIVEFNALGLSFKLDLPANKRTPEVEVSVQINGQTIELNVDGSRTSSYRFKPQGVANSDRLNILIPCRESTREKLESLFNASDNFVLLDFFGDQESLGETRLGASQHPDPLCLMVVGFEKQASKRALKQLNQLLDSRFSKRSIAISPDFYMYSYDPGVASFDSSCDEDSILNSEAESSQDVLLDELDAIISKPNSLSGKGVTIAFFDGGVANASTFLTESDTAALSRRFVEADYPAPNPAATNITDDFDCDETSFKDGHGSLVEQIIKQTAPEADLLALKVCGEHGTCNTSSFVKALLYIRNQYEGFPEIDIINMSFGGDVKRDKVFEALLVDMLKTRTETLVIASLGNSSDEEAHYPAQYQNDYPNVLAVAAAKRNTDNSWTLAAFNTQGTLESLNREPLAAPGVSLILDGLGNPDGVTGTSFAAPIVSAVAALTKERSPSAGMPSIVRHLRDAVDTSYGMQFIQVPQ